MGMVAVARFRVVAAWFGALLQGESSVETLFPLERIVHTVPESVKYHHLAHMSSSMLLHGEEGHFSVRDDTFWNTSCLHGMRNFAASSTLKRATPSGRVTLFC